MTVEFRKAKREAIPLLIGLAGGTGSGKTMSALRIATGLAGGNKFAVIDTENGRALQYADTFTFDHADLRAPFRPDAYADAIELAAAQGYKVIVVDSMSHEHAGDGGLLDWFEEEFERMGHRDAVKMTAWIKPKQGHKRMVTKLLQLPVHIVLCFRAEPKVDMVKDSEGRIQVVPKATLTGLDGWIPVAEKTLPYELTVSALLMADRPGVPKPIKLPEPLRPMVPLDRVLDEDVGRRLAEWAAGGTQTAPQSSNSATSGNVEHDIVIMRDRLLEAAAALGKERETFAMIQRNAEGRTADKHLAWLTKQVEAAEAKIPGPEEAPPEPAAAVPPTGAGSPAPGIDIGQEPMFTIPAGATRHEDRG